MPRRVNTGDQVDREAADLRHRVAELETELAERKRAERSLKSSAAWYSSLVEAFDCSIYVCSSNHEVEFMNDGAKALAGRSAVGEKCYAGIFGLESVCPWCVSASVFRGETVKWEFLNPKDNRWYLVVYSPLRNLDGSLSALAVTRDITELKKTNQDLLRMREELERRVSHLTKLLSRTDARLKNERLECKRLEEQVRTSEQTQKQLIELFPSMVFETDGQGEFTFAYEGGQQSLGYSAKELIGGIGLTDIVVSTELNRLRRDIAGVLQGESLHGREYTFQRLTGATFPVLVYTSPITRDENVVGIRGLAIEVTKLRKAEERLWLKDSAMACSINAIILADLDEHLTYVNPSFLRMWGYERSREALGKPLRELLSDSEDVTKIREEMETNGWWIGEVIARKKTGDLFDAQLSATLVTNRTGEPICMMVNCLDVSERKELLESLRISEERFRTIFEGARDCIFIKDQDFKYAQVNPAVERLLGLPASEIVGRTAEDVFGEAAGKRLREVARRALAGQSVEEEHTRPVRKELLTFHEITAPLRSASGDIIGTATISRNITERRKTRAVPRKLVTEYPSHAMRSALNSAQHAASADSTILLIGESGSGKDYVAGWIHNRSRRSSGPFSAVNCAALPQELAESELFGHEAGAFTGARSRKRGLLELAEGGTLLLNEIGELPLSLQSKLLTFLDTRSFMRVGGEKSIHINARLIAATHRDLEAEVAAGGFLPALFHRINVFRVHVPPLRERLEDIPILVEEIVAELAREMQLPEIPVMDASAISHLYAYHWPGNVRELRNVLERALILWDGGPFTVAAPGSSGSLEDWCFKVGFPAPRNLYDSMEEVRSAICNEALRRAQGNKKEAAQMLGISRYSLYRHLKSFEEKCKLMTQD